MAMKLFAFLCLLASATAFVPASPARLVAARSARAPNTARPAMSMDALPAVDLPVAEVSQAVQSAAQSTLALATNANDFGGPIFPIAGLLILTGAIIVLAPPVEQ